MPFFKDVYGNASSVHTFGQEAKKQLAMVDETPDYVIACHGGGSNAFR